MLKISFDRLGELLTALGANGHVYLPVRQGGQVNFARWTDNLDYCDDALNTVSSVKGLFFPQSEDLAAFHVQGKSIEVLPAEDPAEPFVVFGVRACDARAMEILDMVFLTDPKDSFYEAKRQSGAVITMACGEPEETCFCSSFGIDAAAPGGDVAMWHTEGLLYWKPLTQKGEALTQGLGDLFKETDTEDEKLVETHQAEIRDILSQLPLADVRPEAVGENCDELFNSEQWAGLSSACLGCGSCTFICPTCQCYDIRDFDAGHKVRRFRCWDSCMYSDFTLMAHGNPRTTQLERFRQRFMHKLAYFPENNHGIYSCVGCGRCVAKCPISMNIAKVIGVLGRRENVSN